MGFVLSAFGKDIRRWRQDYMAILIWLSIPLLIGGLIMSLMGDDVKPHGVLLLVDEDESFLSELVVGAYSAGELGELISVEKTSYEEGLARVNDGEASGLLVIPDGFAEAFVESTPATLTLRTNPAQTILPGIIQNVTEILLDAGFYAHQLFGAEIERFAGMTEQPGDAEVAQIAVAIQNKVEDIAPQIFPPVFDLEIVEPPPTEPSPPLALLFMPGIILMAVMFSANGLASDFWKERSQGTLRRLVSTPTRLGQFVAGKALGAVAIIALVSGFTLVIGFAYHGIAWGRLPLSIAWVSVSGVALFAWFAALQMIFSDQRTANIVSTALLFPLLMAGGSFFPLAVMPSWIAALGRIAPNGFVADRLTMVVAESGGWGIDLNSWLIVLIAGVAGLTVCAWRLRSGFARA